MSEEPQNLTEIQPQIQPQITPTTTTSKDSSIPGITEVQGAAFEGSPVATLEGQLRGLHRAQSEAFLLELSRAGGVAPWFRSRCPRLSAVCSETGTDRAIETLVPNETRSFWVGLETRLDECADCKPGMARCRETSDRLPPGVLVKLRVKGSVPVERLSPCPRYQEYRLSQRLEHIGVSPRLSGATMPTAAPPAVRAEFELFLESGTGELAPRAQLLIHGKTARGYGVALLRACLLAYPKARYHSVQTPLLVREAKNALTTKQEYPLIELVDFDVLVIDGIDDSLIGSKHWLGEMQWLIATRRDQRRATILTSSHEDVRKHFKSDSVLPV